MNALLLKVLEDGSRILPRQLWRSFINDIKLEGDAVDVASLAAISKAYDGANRKLLKQFPALAPDTFKRPRAKSA